tara:strand:+ start:487 stop:1152 length:666 start_codon:yes stop_codon:yes gene_type:complete
MTKLKNWKENCKKGLTCAVTGMVGLTAGFMGANIMLEPATITETEYVTEYVNQTVTEYVNQTVEVEVEVEVPVEVLVDNENLGLVLDHIYNNDGQIEYLLDDLDDDEVDFIVDRIVFINDIKTLGVNFIENELANELDDYLFTNADNSTTEFDDDDIEDIDVDDDFNDIVVEDVDFDDDEADLIYEVKFEHNNVDYVASVRVEFRDGEADELDVLSVELDS